MICEECGKELTDEDAYGHDCEVGIIKEKKELLDNLDEKIKGLKNDIEDKKKEIADLEDWELDEKEFDDYIDSSYPDVTIVNSTHSTSWVWKQIDEIAYSMGLREEEDRIREEKREEFQRELDDLESELNELRGEDG